MGTRSNRLSEAVLTCIHNLCFEQNKKNITIFHLEIIIFFSYEISQYIAWTCLRNALLIYLSFEERRDYESAIIIIKYM